MSRISAAGHLVIETAPSQWVLRINTDFVERVEGTGIVMLARAGKPLRYIEDFANTRHLPTGGTLPTHYVQRVVLGWSVDDEAWHLGMLLEPELADKRGSRWCELVHWPDPDQDVFRDLALEAGRSLSRVLGKPFSLIPPRPVEKATSYRREELPALPIRLGTWTLLNTPYGWLQLTRRAGWAWERRRRVLWYSFWAVVYIALSLVTLRAGIALPRPEFLPFVGLGTAILLGGIVGYNLFELTQKSDRVIVDPETQQIWGAKGGTKRAPKWRFSRDKIDSIYVSQVVNQRKKGDTPRVQYGEINLRLTDGEFYYLMQAEPEDDQQPSLNGTSHVGPLHPQAAVTDLQAAAVYLAQALDVPCWYDHRIR